MSGDIRERARAARCYVDASRLTGDQHRQLELDAFMGVFHPEHKRIVLERESPRATPAPRRRRK